MRTDQEIKSIIEHAFRPLRCGAEICDYGQKLRFRVFDPSNQSLINVPRLVLGSVRADALLSSIIHQLRERVEARGFGLQPWQLPNRSE